jgi:hypothetical protein
MDGAVLGAGDTYVPEANRITISAEDEDIEQVL